MKNILDKATTEHCINIINFYMMYQSNFNFFHGDLIDNKSISNTIIYEFTGHIIHPNASNTEIQFNLGKICNNFHCHLSRILLGNNWRIIKYQHMQPAILWFFDQEGTRQRQYSKRILYPHIHGLVLMHKDTLDLFLSNTLMNKNGRRYLLNSPRDFSEISFGQIYNGRYGIRTFIDYSLKLDKINRRKGDNIYSWDFCPSENKSWNKYYKEIPHELLHVYKI